MKKNLIKKKKLTDQKKIKGPQKKGKAFFFTR